MSGSCEDLGGKYEYDPTVAVKNVGSIQHRRAREPLRPQVYDFLFVELSRNSWSCHIIRYMARDCAQSTLKNALARSGSHWIAVSCVRHIWRWKGSGSNLANVRRHRKSTISLEIVQKSSAAALWLKLERQRGHPPRCSKVPVANRAAPIPAPKRVRPSRRLLPEARPAVCHLRWVHENHTTAVRQAVPDRLGKVRREVDVLPGSTARPAAGCERGRDLWSTASSKRGRWPLLAACKCVLLG